MAPLIVGDSAPAYLLTLDDGRDDDEDLGLLLTEHAATVCAVILGRERVAAAAAEFFKADESSGC